MSNANTVYLYSGNTLINTYTTIQAAISAASAFDTIKIGAGTYDENVNVNINGLTIENMPGAQVTILGQGGAYGGALTIASGVFGVTIKSSDGIPGNFVVEGATSGGQTAALYLVGDDDNIKINGITTIAPTSGVAGLNSVLTGGNLNNILFVNNVFNGNADQLVYVNGAEDIGPSAQDGLVSFVGNTFSGSAPNGPLLGMDAPGEIINNKFTGNGAVDVGLGEAGVTVSGNTFSNAPSSAYFLGNGAYDPQAVEANNSFASQGAIYIIQNGVRQDGVYSSIQAAIDAAIAGDTIVAGAGIYDGEINVDKSLTIEGANFGVSGTGTRGAETEIIGGMVVSADDVIIDGVQINGGFSSATKSQLGTDRQYGLIVESGESNVTVQNSLFTGEGAAVDSRPFGTEGGVAGVYFIDNAVTGWQEGAYIVNGGTGSITGNTFTNDGNGVVTESVGMVISNDSFVHSGTPPYDIGSDIAAVGNQSNVDLGTFIGPNDTFSAGDNTQLSVYLNASGPVTVTNDTGISAHIHGEYVSGPVTYNGGTASDTITGSPSNDTFNVGSGNDTIDGGAGTDTVQYDAALQASDITVVNGQWQVSDGADGTDTLNNVEKVSDGTHTFLLVGAGGFTSIQAAIDAASDGDTILVAAGTYNESLNIDKGVTILGANAGILGTGVRGAETIITGQSQITTTSQVTINGVEFLDNQPYTLSSSDGFVALTILDDSMAGDVVEDSVFNRAPTSNPGTFSPGTFVGSNAQPTHRGIELASVGANTQVTIENNLFTGTDQYSYAGDDWRTAIYSNGGAGTTNIDDNTFENVRTGVNADNFSSSVQITGNSLDHDGSGVSIGVGSDVTNVTSITNNTFGVAVDNEFNFRNLTTPVTFNAGAAGNVLSNAAASNPNEYLYIEGGSAGDNLAGTSGNDILLGDAGNNTLTGAGGNDVLYGGTGITTANYLSTLTASNITVVSDADPFTPGNQPGWQVDAGAAEGTDLLNGIYAVQGASSLSSTGHFLLVGDGGYATIQAAIDAASGGDTILVAAGTYNESLNIDKGVTILGANAGISGTGVRGAETIITGQSQITTTSQVTINGIEFLDNQPYTLSSSDKFVALTILDNSAAGDLIEDSVFSRAPTSNPQGFSANTFVGSNLQPTHRGIELASVGVGTQITIENNLFTGTDQYSYAGNDWRSAIYSNGGAGTTTIEDNTFENVRSAVNADNFSSTVQITGNSLDHDGSGVSIGVGSDVTNITSITNNTFGVAVDNEFNFSNLTTPITFNAGATGNVLSNAATSSKNEYLYIEGGSAGDNLTGTSGNDILLGDNGDNTLTGGAGDDILTGGTGDDTFNVGSGNNVVTGGGGLDTANFASTLTAANFSFSNNEWMVTNGASTDDLSGISLVTDGTNQTFLLVDGGGQYSTISQASASPQFTAGDIIVAPTPVVTATSPSVTATPDEGFSASNLFSASSRIGSPIVSYEIEDESVGSSNGFWTLNGIVESNGQIFTVTASQLSELSFTAGSSTTGPITDTLDVAASDAAGFGAFTTFTVVAAKNASEPLPVVTAANETKLPETTLAASSMFGATAATGLSITSYEVEDTTSNSGSWIFNGVTEPANQVIDVTAAQLSQLSFQTGFGTDTLMVRANDGTQWGNYTAFTISPKANAAPPAGTTTVLDLEKPATGVYEYYDIGKNGILQAGPLDQISTSLSVVGIGGFNGSDTADLLTRNTATGAFTIYDVSNNNVTGSTPMGQVGLEWQVAGFGDFSGNAGETDMLMRNTNGQFEVYDIRNNGITGAASMGQVGMEWQVAGFGDFSTTAGETDMLMRNTNTGQFELYDISHNQLVGAASMGQVGLEWQVLGFGDFSGNANETDMLMQNKNSGAFEVYDIRNNQIVGAASMGQVGLQWTVAGFADFSGNANETDLLMRNSASGAFELYDIKGNTITSASGIGSVGTEWQVAGVAVDPPPGLSSAAASTVLSGPTDDPAGGNSISQLTQAMASIAAPGGTSSATAPLGQSPMPGADILATTMQNNPHA